MKEKLTNEDYRHIAEVLLSMGTNINELPRTTETAGAISLPAVLDGKLVAVDLEQLLAALKAATTEAQSATSAALKAKVDTVAATAEASNAAEGANAVISEHAAVALRALMGATALFDDIIEDVTIQAANPSSETGGSVVYVRAKKQFAFKLLQGAVTTYYANWSNDVLYHEHDSYAIAKDKIYVDSTALYVWNEQLQDIKKVSSEAVVQLVQTITGDADKAPSAAAVFKALQGVQADIDAANGKADGLETRVTKLEEGGVSVTVEQEVKRDSSNAVSGGAVYNELLKINADANNNLKFTDGAFLKNDGTLSKNEGWSVSDYVPVLQGLQFSWKSIESGNTYLACLVYYDIDKNFLSCLSGVTSNGDTGDITVRAEDIPADARFMRCSIITAKKKECSINYIYDNTTIVNNLHALERTCGKSFSQIEGNSKAVQEVSDKLNAIGETAYKKNVQITTFDSFGNIWMRKETEKTGFFQDATGYGYRVLSTKLTKGKTYTVDVIGGAADYTSSAGLVNSLDAIKENGEFELLHKGKTPSHLEIYADKDKFLVILTSGEKIDVYAKVYEVVYRDISPQMEELKKAVPHKKTPIVFDSSVKDLWMGRNEIFERTQYSKNYEVFVKHVRRGDVVRIKVVNKAADETTVVATADSVAPEAKFDIVLTGAEGLTTKRFTIGKDCELCVQGITDTSAVYVTVDDVTQPTTADDKFDDIDEKFADVYGRFPSSDFAIDVPDIINVMEGREIAIYDDEISLSLDKGLASPVNYKVFYKCEAGEIFDRGFRYTPDVVKEEEAPVKEQHVCHITVTDNSLRVLAEKDVTLSVVRKSDLKARKTVVYCGDSTGQGALNCLYDNCKEDNLSIDFVGSAGGWKWTKLDEDEYAYYAYTRDKVEGIIIQNEIYKDDNGNLFKIYQYVNTSEGWRMLIGKFRDSSKGGFAALKTPSGTLTSLSTSTSINYERAYEKRGDTKGECYGGWLWDSFAGAGEIAYRIYVDELITVDLHSTIYKDGAGAIFTISENNTTEGVGGNLLLIKHFNTDIGKYQPLQMPSGVLTKLNADATGNNTISYRDAFEESANPFYNKETKQLDFHNYRVNVLKLPEDKKIDLFCFTLGLNGSGIINNGKELEKQIITVYEAIQQDSPGCRVAIGMPPTCANSAGGAGANYGASWNLMAVARNMQKIRQLYIELAKRSDLKFLKVAPINLNVDRYYGYVLGKKAVSRRCDVMIDYHLNHLHPAKVGYHQMADEWEGEIIMALL